MHWLQTRCEGATVTRLRRPLYMTTRSARAARAEAVARAEAQVATRAALGKVEAAAAAAVVAALARVEVATAAAAVGATGMRMPTCSWKAVMDSPKADGFSGSGAD